MPKNVCQVLTGP